MPTFGDLSKYKQKSNAYTVPSYVAQQKYSLTDLRKDEEFNKVTERFLTSLGEGETVGDLFGYFRGADYNLGDATKMVFESGKFTQQQKTDYQYLRNKFDNADVGGFGEWVRAGANVTKEIITDPTMIASALFIPWTGGTSAVSRIAAGKAVQTTLKKLANKEIAEGVSKGVAKLPGQTLKAPMSKNAKTVAASTEGFIYGSTANFTKQHADVNTDRREEVSPEESLAMGAITAAIPAVFRGAGAGYTKFNKSIADRRAARIDGNEDYKVGIIDKGIEKTDAIIEYVTPNIRILTGFVNKPTSILLEKMEASPTLDKIVKYFRYDAAKSITAKDYDVSQKVSSRSFYEDVNSLIGFRSEQLKAIIDPLKTKGTVTVPKLGSRDSFFKIPFKDAPKAEKQSYFKRQRIADNVNDALAYYLRTGRKTVTVDGKQIKLEQAFKLTDKSTDDIITAGQGIKKLMSDIRNDAKREGLEIGLIKNYLPRGFSYGDVKAEIKNLEKGIEGKLVKELKTKEGLKTNEDVIDLLQDIINPSKTAGKSYTELATVGKGEARKGLFFPKTTPGLTKERTLKNIDENNIVDYLDNNVENLLYDYIHQSSSFIQRKAGLGEDLDEFIKRFVNPIKEELAAKGKKLTEKEYKRLEDIYLVTTGQVQQVDNVIGRTLSDIAVVGNQLALLPLATITSLSEVAVPLVRGAGKKSFQKGKTESGVDKGGVRILWETAGDYRKMWWNDLVKKDITDARPESLKELNRFNRAMNRAGEDRSLAMYGQGFGRRATQAQNKFFKINLLHDWTRFVQLTSFNVGKAKMYENLHELTTNKSISSKRKIRLTNELKELGVDVTAGKRWVQSGGKASGKFYDENFLPSAARYVDEVIMNPTAAANQKPLWHSMPSTRWAFGLMGFPTAFSNTVLKNAVREVAIDARSRESFKGTSQAISGVTVMTAIAMFGNTLRSKGRNLEELESGETDIGEEILEAAIRTGLLGPGEQVYRTVEDKEYTNLIRAITQRFTGPAVNDVIKFFDSWVGPLSIGVDKIPGIALLRTTNPETYKEIKSLAKEADKAAGFTAQRKTKEEEKETPVPLYSTGGRVNKFTGGSLTDEYKYYNQLSEEVEKLPEKAEKFIEEREERRTEAHKQIVKATKEGDVRKGFEAFETLPIGEQLAGYMNPVTNAPLSATGALIYAEKAKPSVKTLKEFAIDFINPTKNILQKTPIKVEDPMSAGISAMEAFGVVPFIGGVGKFGSKTLRKIQARRGDDTMGGGGSGKPPINKEQEYLKLSEKYYKDSEGVFYSPVLKTLLLKAPENVKGEALLKWLNNQEGIKKEELNFLKLDEYVKENPKAAAMDMAKYSDDKKLEINTNVRVEYAKDKSYPVTFIEENSPEEGIKIIRPKNIPFISKDEAYAYGNDKTGYDIFMYGENITQRTAGDFGRGRKPLNKAEAEIQLQGILKDEGILDVGNYNQIEYKNYIDRDLPGGKNYEEITFNLNENAVKDKIDFDKYPSSSFHFQHKEDETQFAHALIRDRKVRADNSVEIKNSLHVDELQSDLHTLGYDVGYKNSTKDKIEVKKITEETKEFNKNIDKLIEKTKKDVTSFKKENSEILNDSQFYDFENIIKKNINEIEELSRVQSSEPTRKVAPLTKINRIYNALTEAEYNVVTNKVEKLQAEGKITNSTTIEEVDKLLNINRDKDGLPTHYKYDDLPQEYWDLSKKNQELLERKKVIDKKIPDYPYKNNWHEPVLKQLLYKAVKENKDALSVSTSDVILTRYSGEGPAYKKMLYDKRVPSTMEKLAKKYKGEFQKKGMLEPSDINPRYDEYLEQRAIGKPLSSTGKNFLDAIDVGDMDANIIFITPEMREKILKEGVPGFAKGGLVKGKDDVPYTKENPANRVDPFTGQPYSSQMEELGLNVFQEK